MFKNIGLSGRAVIPLVLGFGCATMATVVTRTLPTKRERLLATLLLSLAIPCSAQLGVVLAVLASHPRAMLAWAGVIGMVFLTIGFLMSRVLPGEHPSFYMELPPLRLPNPANIFMKTYVRVKWYFIEILPLFLLTSVLIWLGQMTGIFQILVKLMEKPTAWIGLPKETAQIFLFGFFRRDYGAAGLYDLNQQGILSGRELAVSCIALTLFLPCVAQFLVNIKERGIKWGLGISFFILFFSFAVAFVVNFLFQSLGIL
jgi:ferrous iron transport protein B